jgi:hypothetical protein
MLCLIDPALQDHAGRDSDNLGDVVIYRAISRVLSELFPGEEIVRISSHEPLEESHYEIMRSARIVFQGGSNLLSSDVLTYNQWNFTRNPGDYHTPRFDNSVLFGVGWWQYQDPPTAFTSDFYRKILSPSRIHSVRDGYTANRLRDAGITNVVNTGCPSMWGLEGVEPGGRSEDCVLTLTDYYKRPEDDERLLRTALFHFRKIYFFPQGTGDVEYIQTLGAFREYPGRFQILDHSLGAFESLLDSERPTYFGTRLHGGIVALNHRVPSLILGVDNRATEMARDFQLPVVPRTDQSSIDGWLRGHLKFPAIRVFREQIERWRAQFGAVQPPTRAAERA